MGNGPTLAVRKEKKELGWGVQSPLTFVFYPGSQRLDAYPHWERPSALLSP